MGTEFNSVPIFHLAILDHVLAALLELFLFPLVPLLDGTEKATDTGVNFGFLNTLGRHIQGLSFVRGEEKGVK
jgi:hypothetical protein